MTRTPSLARVGLIAFLAVLGLGLAPRPAAEPARAQGGTASWTTFAGGDEVLALAIDPSDGDRLWAGTEGGGVVVWDLAAAGEFQQYLFPTQPGLGSNQVYDIAFEGQTGEAWLATAAGVTLAARAGWTGYLPDDPTAPDDTLPDPPYVTIAVDDTGEVWTGGPDGLASMAPGGAEWEGHPAVDYTGDEGPHDGPGATNVAAIAIGADGLVYVAHGRGNNGNQPALSIYDPAIGTWRHIAAIAPNGDPTTGPRSDQILDLALDDAGEIWMASWGRGVLRWDGQGWEEYARADGVCSDQIWAITAAGGEVWAACGSDRTGEGVARWDGSSWEAWSTSDGLASDVITAIAGGGSRVFFGTNGMGTNSPDSTGGQGIIPFDGEKADDPWRTAPETPWSNDINALAFQSDGTLWAGTRAAGLMRYRPQGGQWERFTVESSAGKLVGDTISDLAIRDQSELWVSTVQTILENGSYIDGGVSRLDLASDDWLEPLLANPASPGNSLPEDTVSSLAIGPDNRVWMGLGDVVGGKGGPPQSGEGVAVFDPERSEWDFYSYDHDLAGATVTDLASAAGQVWVASSYAPDEQQRRVGGGASRFSAGLWSQWASDRDGFRTYHGTGNANDTDGLITGDVRSVMVDRDGGAWAGTYSLDAGGSLISAWPFVDAVANFQQTDGTWLNEGFAAQGWVSSIAQDSLGQIWAGTTRGHFKGFDAFVEFAPTRNQHYDTAAGGVRLRTAGGWVELSPWTSGIASNAITALAVDPATGAVWVGTENNGFSVYRGNQLQATPTPGTPTAPPAATSTPIGPTLAPGTMPPAVTLPPLMTRVPTTVPDEDDDDEPDPPPEVPEASTLMLLAAGLAGLASWVGMRRRRG